MKIVFTEKYFTVYETDPAAEEGRLEPTYRLMKKYPDFYEFVEPKPASEEDILRAHTREHVNYIKRRPLVHEMAALAAGGAILAAEIAYNNAEPVFALIRPPGHHASADSCWGFCFYNNMSIALLKLMGEGKINGAFILDFDLHTGDGNINILSRFPKIKILNPHASDEPAYMLEVKKALDSLRPEDVDILCASAGFDNAVGDWGGTLSGTAYRKLGEMLKEYSLKLCGGRRFAILEGGYNFELMAVNIDNFCRGFA